MGTRTTRMQRILRIGSVPIRALVVVSATIARCIETSRSRATEMDRIYGIFRIYRILRSQIIL